MAPPVVDTDTWQRQLDTLRAREKAAIRELDAIAAQRRRLPMVQMPDYTLEGEQGTVRLEGWPRSPTYSRWTGSEEIGK